MLPPHWLDEVIGDLRDPKQIADAIADSEGFKKGIATGLKNALDQEKEHERMEAETGRRPMSGGFNQLIRVAVVDAMSDQRVGNG